MKKTLGFVSVFCISAGAMISSGLFVLPGLAFAKAGPVVFLSYFLAGCVALSTVLSLSELVTAMPKGGGDYYYVSRTFGRFPGTVSGVLSWLALSLKSAFAIIGLGELAFLVLGIDLKVAAAALAVAFTLLNLKGVKEAVRFQVLLVIGLLIILGTFAFLGVQEVSMSRYDPFLAHGFNAMFSTAGFVFVSFGGVLTTASIAGEIRNPVRNIPLAFIGSTVVVTLVYAIVTFVVVGVVPSQQLSSALAPVAMAASTVGGDGLYLAVMVASFLAFVTTANGGILTASRYPVALASDGTLPGWFGRVSSKNQTPVAAVIATGSLILVSVFLDLDLLVKAASTVILLSNIFAHLSIIVMRESRISTYRPTFKAPFYPWVQVIGIGVFCFLIADMGIQPVLLALLFVAVGVVLYFCSRKNDEKTGAPAVLHLIERITDRELGTSYLVDELRDVISERDQLVMDDLDVLLTEAPVLDLEGEVSFDYFLRQGSEALAKHLDSVDAQEIANLIQQREAESPTAITDFVAVPHLVLEGSNKMCVMLVRARDGIRFSDEHSCVRAVFVLAGTRDLRHVHLRALAAIAHVVQNKGFEKAWLQARRPEELRSLFLLSQRKRAEKSI
jgi:amino acid transporter/mannitol/fructose-specific phosphotransferase system IIA component (Ntr-type)